MSIAPNTYVQVRSIGGSDAAAVMGVSRYKTAAQVYDAITGRSGIRPTEKDRGPTERGRFMEDVIVKLYERESQNITSVCERTWAKDHPFLHASPDRLIETVLPEHRGILEIKAPGTYVVRSIKDEGIPAEYYIQMQHYMFVLGLTWGDFVALDYDAWEPIIIKVHRDEQTIAEIVEKCTSFWLDYVEQGIRPPDDRIVADEPRWPKGRPGAPKVRKDPDFLHASHQLQQAITESKLAARSLELAKEQVKQLMGEDEEIVSGDLRICWKEGTHKSFDVEALAQSGLLTGEQLESFYKRTAVRKFNVYPAKGDRT